MENLDSNVGHLFNNGLMDRLKTSISWLVWPATHIIMNLLLPFISVKVYYEDVNFQGVQKPLILVSNHKQIVDPWFISFGFPFDVLFGKIFPLRPYSSLYVLKKNVLGRIFKSLGIMKVTYFIYNTIPIPGTGSFEDKINPLVNAIKNGESILMFPEGRLMSDGTVSEFKRGAIKVHELTGAPILPIALRYQRMFFPFYSIYIAIGKPIHLPEELLNKGAENEFYDARVYLQEKVSSLYQETYNLKKS